MPTPDVVNLIPANGVAVLSDTANNITGRVPIYSITRVGGTATIKAYNHGLSTGTYTVAGTTSADYNISATLTKVDADTLTYTVANSPATPAQFLGQGWILDLNNSPVVTEVKRVQIEVPPSATTLKLYKKLHPDGSWVQEGSDITNGSSVTIVTFDPPMAMVKLNRSGGTGNYKAFWQKG